VSWVESEMVERRTSVGKEEEEAKAKKKEKRAAGERYGAASGIAVNGDVGSLDAFNAVDQAGSRERGPTTSSVVGVLPEVVVYPSQTTTSNVTVHAQKSLLNGVDE